MGLNCRSRGLWLQRLWGVKSNKYNFWVALMEWNRRGSAIIRAGYQHKEIKKQACMPEQRNLF